jgi:cystathionine beta-synthase
MSSEESKNEQTSYPCTHTAEGEGQCWASTINPNYTEHEHRPSVRHEGILPNILYNIGQTPMVRINRLGKEAGLKCDLVAKCEFFNSGGSVKDRIGLRMIEDAEKSGRLHDGDVLIEPTSGNTGIGLALTAAVKNYRMIITLPEKMSQEKVDVLKALGAEIIRTPTEAAFDSPDSHIGVANRLNGEIENSHILDQYSNPSNPLAHYDTTAEEIWEQTGGQVDMVVLSAGTGGTVTGIARKLKEKNPNIIVIGVDPVGSILAVPDSLNDENRLCPYQVEGIGYDFIPDVLQREVVDRWEKTNDRESFIMARKMIRQEGLLCGGSSGSAMAAALKAAQTLEEGQRCVVLLPDSVRNYMTKFLNDDWMVRNDFVDGEIVKVPERSHWWSNEPLSVLNAPTPTSVAPSTPIREAIHIMHERGFDMLPVVEESGNLLGVVSEGNVTSRVTKGAVSMRDPVSEALFKKVHRLPCTATLNELALVFDLEPFCLIMSEDNSAVEGVVSRIDLLKYISNNPAEEEEQA